MSRATNNHILNTRRNFENLGGQLNLVSPLATLERGFAIAKSQQGVILRSSDQVTKKEQIKVVLNEGTINCDVVDTIK